MVSPKKILLISTSSRYVLDKSTSSYSFALGFLSSILKKYGYSVKVLDLFCEEWSKGKKILADTLNEFNPSVVGFNMLTMNRSSTYESINLVNDLFPSKEIILGGCHATIMHEQLLNNFSVNSIVLGEGEETIIELLDAIEKKRSLKDVKGIAFKDKNGEIVVTPQRPFIKDLDSLPMIEHSRFLDENSKTAFLFTSRGCPFNCSFCSSSVHWRRICRLRSPKSVVDEIQYIVNTYPNVEEVRFMDDTFTMDNNRVIEICKEIVNRNIKIKWRCSARVHPLSREVVKWMDRAGCIMIGFGIETGSEKLLNQIGKQQTIGQIISAYRTIYENSKIIPDTFLIVGLPNEDLSTINETISLIKQINKIGRRPLLLTAARMLEIYPGTRIYNLAKSREMINEDYWITHSETPLFLEHSERWLKKMRFKIILANWTSCGILPIVKIFFEKKAWKPRKIYNVLRPYIKGIN